MGFWVAVEDSTTIVPYFYWKVEAARFGISVSKKYGTWLESVCQTV